MKEAIIFDLDNTIYGAPTIGNEIFAPILQWVRETGEHQSTYEAIREDILRKPFQIVAATHGFSTSLTQRGMDFLSGLYYKGPIVCFPDYVLTKEILLPKYLVTTGFQQLQQSKIDGLHISDDFKELHIIDPATTTYTKKDIFQEILARNHHATAEVLVVGDDLHSEIKAAQDLGIDVVVYDKYGWIPADVNLPVINHFSQLAAYL